MADSRAPGFWRARRVQIIYALAGLALFLAFIVAWFPYPEALSDALAPMGYKISIGSQGYSFPFGAALHDVTIMPTAAPGAALLSSDRVVVAPSFISFLMFHPGIRVKADLFGGVIDTSARPNNGGTTLNFALDAIQIETLKLLTSYGLIASGSLSGSGKAWLTQGGIASATGNADVKATDLKIAPPAPFPAVSLGEATGSLTLADSTVKIANLETHGGEIALTANGTINLADSPNDSTVDIEFTMIPTPDAAARLGPLFAGLPHPPGPEPYHLRGTLAAPAIM
jgi:type II secretion system protein N